MGDGAVGGADKVALPLSYRLVREFQALEGGQSFCYSVDLRPCIFFCNIDAPFEKGVKRFFGWSLALLGYDFAITVEVNDVKRGIKTKQGKKQKSLPACQLAVLLGHLAAAGGNLSHYGKLTLHNPVGRAVNGGIVFSDFTFLGKLYLLAIRHGMCIGDGIVVKRTGYATVRKHNQFLYTYQKAIFIAVKFHVALLP